jgi:hypothetical protein
MGLFNHKVEPSVPEPEPAVEQSPTEAPSRKMSLFSRRSSVSPVDSPARTNTNASQNTVATHRNLLHRHDEADPSILAAQERLMNAERAEKDADTALAAASEAVKEARQHVRDAREQIKLLEKEAAEQ